MPYGEGLAVLSPCDSRSAADLLATCLSGNAAVLDVGCGRGDTLEYFSNNTAYELYGADSDSELLAIARERCPEVRFARAMAEELPFPGCYFDAAVMECVFSILPAPDSAARELRRVLKPGGILLLSDLYARGTQGCLLEKNALLSHIRTRVVLEEILERAGLTPESFTDYTRDMQGMLAQMVMDGSACEYFRDEERAALRRVKAGYGVWIFRRAE